MRATLKAYSHHHYHVSHRLHYHCQYLADGGIIYMLEDENIYPGYPYHGQDAPELGKILV
jgi:hypothetical protein